MIEPFEKELAKVSGDGLHRKLRLVENSRGRAAVLNGREVILFSSNNYLGLANHPDIKQAVKDCLNEYGWGSGASRLISGSMPPHARFEEKAAAFLGKPSALLFNSGYTANIGVLTSLMGRGGTVFADRLCHASIIDGARFSGAELKRYKHNDPGSLRGLIKKSQRRGKRLIVTDGVFSMDGDKAPLGDLADIAEESGALFMVDDAHGLGVCGPEGRGTAHESGVAERVDIHVATLGKALGGFGGFVAGSRSLIDGLINFSRSFIYSTSLPPSAAAAGMAALSLVSGAVGEAKRRSLRANIRKIMVCLENLGYDNYKLKSHIVPVFLKSERQIETGMKVLIENGVFAPVIRPPTVPKGTTRLRLSVMADHTESDLEKLSYALAKLKEL